MFLVYVGESGQGGSNLEGSQQPHHVIAGLVVHEDRWAPLKADFLHVERRYFPDGSHPEPDGLIHPSQVLGGQGPYSTWPADQQQQLIGDLVRVLVQWGTPVIACYAEKGAFTDAKPPGDAAFSGFLFSLGLYMDEFNIGAMSPERLNQGEPVALTERATIVAGWGISLEPGAMQEYVGTEIDLPSGAVLETVHFVRPQDSPGAQLADLCAYLVGQDLEAPSQPSEHFSALRDAHLLEVLYQVRP